MDWAVHVRRLPALPIATPDPTSIADCPSIAAHAALAAAAAAAAAATALLLVHCGAHEDDAAAGV